ncbi:CbtB domain-containing protein [Litoreibacter roseus]|uniref:Cobalt transporter subunit CbtB n=1 Tax=Litoreibacter roseus TaxID=2601869 RepID=A0A6N6JFU6_9RHOB|nr:CbtB domain-containing protein [Litoreibacter roseus]GFE65005.1 hypothetical protein KIN_20790 [Litoreibacter roseus]
MKNDVKVIAKAQPQSRIDSDLIGIATAALLGLFLLFAAGFAQATVLHDTAHDQRHAMAFPCH